MLRFKFKGVKREFDKLNRQLEVQVKELTEEDAEQLIDNLRDATPIDQGQARDGWEITRSTSEDGEKEITITNNVPYISELNQGSSQQAGPRFIEREVLKLFEPRGVIVKRKRS